MLYIEGNKYLNEKELSNQFGFSLSWLRKIRYSNKQFPYHKLDRRVLFKEDEIHDWLKINLIRK